MPSIDQKKLLQFWDEANSVALDVLWRTILELDQRTGIEISEPEEYRGLAPAFISELTLNDRRLGTLSVRLRHSPTDVWFDLAFNVLPVEYKWFTRAASWGKRTLALEGLETLGNPTRVRDHVDEMVERLIKARVMSVKDWSPKTPERLEGVRDWHARPAPKEAPFEVDDVIELIHMPGEIGPGRPQPGERGVVKWVNWVGLGSDPFWQFSVDWEGGSGLMLSIPPDSARRVDS